MKKYQQIESGSYYCEGMTVPKSLGNRHYIQMLEEVEGGLAEILQFVKAEPTEREKADTLKFKGVLFNKVLCSAEAEDMWGLSSIKDFIVAGNSTPFVFKNGNTLLLTPDNLADFQAVWIPFRLGFFK